MTQFLKQFAAGMVILAITASSACPFSQPNPKPKMEVLFEWIKKIISDRGQLKLELEKLKRKKTLYKKTEEELKAIMNLIKTFNPYGSGDVCTQTVTIINRLRYLDQEKVLLFENDWLVENNKVEQVILIGLLSVVVLNLVVWGAVKTYYCLTSRKKTAERENSKLKKIFNYIVESQPRGSVQARNAVQPQQDCYQPIQDGEQPTQDCGQPNGKGKLPGESMEGLKGDAQKKNKNLSQCHGGHGKN